MECCALCCLGALLGLLLLYKLLDRLIRWPSVGHFADRYILVTGCDTGFGHGIARRLDGLGCHVFAGCLTDKGETELRKACSDRLQTVSLDVSNHDSVLKAFDIVSAKLPQGQGQRRLCYPTKVALGKECPIRTLPYSLYKSVHLVQANYM
jgi:hypothetical protein